MTDNFEKDINVPSKRPPYEIALMHDHILRLEEELEAIEQECEELKAKCKKYGEINEQETKDYEELKAERDSYIDKYFLESNKVVKLNKTLKEIKAFVQKEIEYFEHDIEYQYDWKELMKLVKINEVKDE